jgi:PleD family two-component response regulator
MMTNAATISPAAVLEPESLAAPTATQKVVIVNGNTEVLDLLETVLDAGHYDVVFVESTEHAYSQIKRVQPNLVILCVNVEDPDGFQVLSMLKLDADTRDIPVLTHTTDGDDDEEDEEAAESSEVELFTPRPATVRMN